MEDRNQTQSPQEAAQTPEQPDSVDALLEDVKSLLGESDEAIA